MHTTIIDITGTREQFRDWLSSTKSMTYSHYSKLSTGMKLELQAEYTGTKKKVTKSLT